MSLAIFLVLALLTAVAVAYPLVWSGEASGRDGSAPVSSPSDSEIARAVGDFRRAREGAVRAVAAGSSACPACRHVYRAGDRFCVQCGDPLPEVNPEGAACASCGAPLRPDDRFCAKCGQNVAAGVGV